MVRKPPTRQQDPHGSGRLARPRIVVGLDGSPGDRVTLAYAVSAAARSGGELTMLTVLRTDVSWAGASIALDTPVDAALRADAEESMERLLDDVRDDPGVTAVPGTASVRAEVRVTVGQPADDLVRASESADLLVVGRRRRGRLGSALLGSVALHCATHAHCPVVVVHPTPPPEARHTVVVGVDGSDCSTEALTLAVREAARLGADVEVVAVYTVVDWGSDLYRADRYRSDLPSPDDIRADAEKSAQLQIDEVIRASTSGEPGSDLSGAVPALRLTTVEGSPADVLVDRADGAALLVVGSRGHGRVRNLLLGSVSLHCAIHATGPVMIVRPSTAALPAV